MSWELETIVGESAVRLPLSAWEKEIMSDAIRRQLRKLQHQLDEAARALDKMGEKIGERGPELSQRWDRLSRRTSDLSHEAEALARRHPAVSGLLVVSVIALAAACFLYGKKR